MITGSTTRKIARLPIKWASVARCVSSIRVNPLTTRSTGLVKWNGSCFENGEPCFLWLNGVAGDMLKSKRVWVHARLRWFTEIVLWSGLERVEGLGDDCNVEGRGEKSDQVLMVDEEDRRWVDLEHSCTFHGGNTISFWRRGW